MKISFLQYVKRIWIVLYKLDAVNKLIVYVKNLEHLFISSSTAFAYFFQRDVYIYVSISH